MHPPGLVCFHPQTGPRYTYFALTRATTVMGRGKDCDIVVDDAGASRRHACMMVEAGRVRIVDEGSANGVIVDGKRVTSTQLKGGEVIRMGDSFFRLHNPGITGHNCELETHTSGIVSGPSLNEVRRVLVRAAKEALTVLILGETGTGKDLAATYLHKAGPRCDGPFVAVNCAAIPPTIVESELFGHTKGSFTGASTDGVGLIRQAHGGTLFLDEIGELPLPVQSKLLRVLQDRQVRAVGATKSASVDVRVVCATNRDLGAFVRSGAFRPDLYARVAELVVELPPLRDRIEDVPLLAKHFIGLHGQPNRRLSAAAIEVLCTRSWSLNVRGLETAIRRAELLAGDNPTLGVEHFPQDALDDWIPDRKSEPSRPPERRTPSTAPESTPRQIDERTKRLEEALRRHHGNVDLAAEDLGLSRSQIYRRAKKAGIDPSRFRR